MDKLCIIKSRKQGMWEPFKENLSNSFSDQFKITWIQKKLDLKEKRKQLEIIYLQSIGTW
jgi:hypothetical protein